MDLISMPAAVFELKDGDDELFDKLWQQIYKHQLAKCETYARYCMSLGVENPAFLPIDAFKHKALTTFPVDEAEAVFQSSGTGKANTRSRHYVKDLSIYEQSIYAAFSRLLGPGPYTLFAYLPHYQAMGGSSSLLYMLEFLIKEHGDEHSGFFLHREAELAEKIAKNEPGRHTILFGAAFGLLNLIQDRSFTFNGNATLVETGGMKTYRQEITRKDLHQQLAEGFGLDASSVWSEYGMCELLSQSYSRGGAVFYPPPWMRFKIMNPEMPLEEVGEGVPGALAVIDLANMHSVSAILTQDKAIKKGEGFEILGRLSGAELRGCNFLLEQA